VGVGLAASSADAATAVGSVSGQFSVNSDGAAAYTIPISLPDGVNGLKPKLSLVYDSQSNVGVAGYGWTLSGLSAISRCGKTIAQDGVIQPLTFTDGAGGDDYCLDGSKLFSDGSGAYRTEIDRFSKVIPEFSGGGGAIPANGPQWFKVRAKDGLTYYYGNTANSEIFGWPPGYMNNPSCATPAKSTSVVRAWALSSIQDRSGNSINFSYCQDVGTGDYWINTITYNGPSGGVGGTEVITFSYDDLASLSAVPADYKVGYRGGMVVGHSERLNGIILGFSSGGSTTTTQVYSLRYQLDTATTYSELKSVTECAGPSCTPGNTSSAVCGGTCLPSTIIQWDTSAAGWTVQTGSGSPALYQTMPMDVFGTGHQDIFYGQYPASDQIVVADWGAYQLNSSGTGLTNLTSDAPDGFAVTIGHQGQVFPSNYSFFTGIPFNFLGNGEESILEYCCSNLYDLHVFTFSPGSSGTLSYSDTDTGLQGGFLTPFNTPAILTPPIAADIDGDGFDDILQPTVLANNDVGIVGYINQKGSFTQSQQSIQIYDSGIVGTGDDRILTNVGSEWLVGGIRSADFNGDGRTDLLTYVNQKLEALVADTDAHGHPILTLMQVLNDADPNYLPLLLDVNGDGLTDIAYVCAPAVTTCTPGDWVFAVSTGTGFKVADTTKKAEWMAYAIAVDYDGDGHQDILWPTNGDWYVQKSVYYPSDGTNAGFYGLSAAQDTGLTAAQFPSFASNANDTTVHPIVAADLDGDGIYDLIGTDSNSTHDVWALHDPVSLRVTSISDGLGNNVSVTYGSLSGIPDAGIYTPADPSTLPQNAAPYQGPLYVVKKYAANSGASDGTAATYTVSYSYQGAARDRRGRGFLGFASITETDSRFGSTTTAYSQGFPFIGKIKTQSFKTLGGNPTRDVTNVYHKLVTLGTTTSPVAVFPFVFTNTVNTYGSSSGDDGIAGIVKTVVTKTAYDAWGNPTLVTTDTNVSGGVPQFETNIISTFSDNTANWCLSLPETVTVEKLIGATDPSPQPGTSNSGYTQQSREVTYSNVYASCRANYKIAMASEPGNSVKTVYSYLDAFGNVNEMQVYASNADGSNATLLRDTQVDYTGTAGVYPTTVTQIDNTNGINLVMTQTWDLSRGLMLTKSVAGIGPQQTVNGPTGQWTYDGFGRKATETAPGLTKTKYVYDSCSAGCISGAAYRLTATHYATDGISAGAVSQATFDSLGRTIETSKYILDDQQVLQDTQYNVRGLATHQSAPHFSGATPYWTITSYDDLQRPQRIERPADQATPTGTMTYFCYDATSCSATLGAASGTAGSPEQYAVTQVVTTSNTLNDAPSAETSVRVTDSQGNVTEVDDAQNSITYGNGAFGDVIQITGSGLSASMGYDSMGHKVSSTDPEMGAWTYQNDALGEVIGQTDANGNVITQGYDMLGRMVTRTMPDTSNPGASIVSNWNYDTAANGAGMLASETKGTEFGRIYTYDVYGRQLSIESQTATSDYTSSVTYDNFGHVAQQIYPATPAAPAVTPPQANAGSNQTVALNSTVNLNGGASSESSNAPLPLAYLWSQTGGPVNVGIDGSRTGAVSFVAATAGIFNFQLMVGDGQSYATASVAVTVDPLAPGNISFQPASPSTTGSYAINWGAAAGATAYSLYESTDGVTFAPATNCAYAALSASCSGKGDVTQNLTYTYEVQGTANGATGPLGNVANIQVNLVPSAPSAAKITPPDSVAGTGYNSTGNYTFGWVAPATGNPQSYNVYQALNGGAFGLLGNLPGTALSYPSFTGMGSSTANNVYKYYVAACDAGGCTNSGTATITVTLKSSLPGKPTFNTTGTNTTGNYNVKWTAPTTGVVTNYEVFESTNNSTWTEIDNGNLTALQQSVSGKGNGTYYYQVAACNVNVCTSNTASSSIAVLLPPGKPGGYSLSPSSIQAGDEFTLAWTVASGSVSYYEVNGNTALEYPSTTRSVNFTSIHDGTHTYYVQACNNSGCGPATATLSVTVSGTISGCPPPPLQCQLVMDDKFAGITQDTRGAMEATHQTETASGISELRRKLASQRLSLLNAAGRQKSQDHWKPVAVASDSTTMYEMAGSADSDSVADAYLRAQETAVYHAMADGDASLQAKLQSQSGMPGSDGSYGIKDVDAPTTSNLVVDYAYDDHEVLQAVVDDQDPTLIYWQAEAMDQWGHTTGEVFGNDVLTTTTYDDATGLALTVQTGVNSSPTAQDLAYVWDGYGNLSSRSDMLTSPNMAESYQYDALNRISSSTIAGSTASVPQLTVGYGNLGQINSKSDAGTYHYDYPGHPTQVSSIDTNSVGTVSYHYDNNGNLSSTSDGKQVSWTSDNKPWQISYNGNSTTIGYDPDGQRYSEYTLSGAIGTTTLEVGSDMEVVKADGGTPIYRLIISAGGNTVAIRTVHYDGSFTVDYMHRDHLGSVDAITDVSTITSDLPVQRMSFDSFGQRRCSSDWSSIACDSGLSSITDRGYTGQMELDSVGLVHMEGRVYDPMLGRFMSPDPTIPDMYNSQSLNRYAYVNNNPMNHTDPTGFDDEALGDGGGFDDSAQFEFENGISVPFDSDQQSDPFLSVGTGDSTVIATNESGNTDSPLMSVLNKLNADLKKGADLLSGLSNQYLGPYITGDVFGSNLRDGSNLGTLTGIAKEFNKTAADVSNAVNPFLHVTYTGQIQSDERFGASLFDGGILAAGGIDEFSVKEAVGFGLKEAGEAAAVDGANAIYPPNHGFLGWAESSTLMPGTVVDRYGDSSGRYLSPQGTPFSARSIKQEQINSPLNTYQVLKPFNVDSGLARPWFGQDGMGIQYHTDLRIQELINQGFLGPVP
jgi:RHS repeat-associated protein